MIIFKKTEEWYIQWQRVTMSNITSDNDWQRVITNDNERPFPQIFFFFRIREETATKHPKENSLNLEENLTLICFNIISNQFISYQFSDGKLQRNIQRSNLFHYAAIKTADERKIEFFLCNELRTEASP